MFGPAARKQGVPPVTGVIHSGGVLADAVLASQTAGEIELFYRPYATDHDRMHRPAPCIC